MKFFTMSSRDEERSLASGIPIPQWMRNKTENYGFDPSTLSPPTHEGDFFYIKFPRPQAPPEPSKYKTLNEVLKDKERAFNKHTDSCKQFIPKIQDTVRVVKPKITKPMGVDDGFKGEGAACGVSVVEVAHQMLTGKVRPVRPFTRGDTEGNLAPSASYLRSRRNSKSLPASPLTSPGSSPLTKRKNDPENPLAINSKSGENVSRMGSENTDRKSGSSWILSSLFALNEKESGKDISGLALENSDPKKLVKSTKDSSSDKESVKMAVEMVPPATGPIPKGSLLKSKPNLRDLNLLSPTSM